MDISELEWLKHVSPVSKYYAEKVSASKIEGKKLACCQHITLSSIPMFLSLKKAGVDFCVASCNLHSTDERAVAYLREHEIKIFARSGMSEKEYDHNLNILKDFNADYLHDMGGDLISKYLDKTSIKGALEATTSGLANLRGKRIPFPVFNWNDVDFKNNLHNRFHVGDSVWSIFSQITGLSLFGRKVLVMGFGPVGRGIATRAHALGADVFVAELDPVRSLEAMHCGLRAVDIFEGLRQCKIIVTATGHKHVLSKKEMDEVQPGTILFNAGHSNEEIDMNFLSNQPIKIMTPHIDGYQLGAKTLFVLAKGSLLNLAQNVGLYGRDVFDFYEGFMLRAIQWLLEEGEKGYEPGMQPFPNQIASEVARVALKEYPTAPTGD